MEDYWASEPVAPASAQTPCWVRASMPSRRISAAADEIRRSQRRSPRIFCRRSASVSGTVVARRASTSRFGARPPSSPSTFKIGSRNAPCGCGPDTPSAIDGSAGIPSRRSRIALGLSSIRSACCCKYAHTPSLTSIVGTLQLRKLGASQRTCTWLRDVWWQRDNGRLPTRFSGPVFGLSRFAVRRQVEERVRRFTGLRG
jgi:hypothetical protein